MTSFTDLEEDLEVVAAVRSMCPLLYIYIIHMLLAMDLIFHNMHPYFPVSTMYFTSSSYFLIFLIIALVTYMSGLAPLSMHLYP